MTVSRLVRALWIDQSGAALSAELILMTTILGIGTIAGLTTVRDQVTFELADLATAFASIDQSYSLAEVTVPEVAPLIAVGSSFSLAGSVFVDTTDFCFDNSSGNTPDNAGTACVALVPGAPE